MKVGIIGVNGYTGQTLLKILHSHPVFEITELTARVESEIHIREISQEFYHYDYYVYPVFKPEDIKLNADAYFLALPHKTAMEYAKFLYDNGKIIIDLSADFRFSNLKLYEKYYVKHLYPELSRKSVYGLPELFRSEIAKARLIGNPGCYPTGIILGVYPLLKNTHVIKIIADSKSGTSGAGYKPSISNVFCNVNENFKAYKIGTHRHQPEIKEVLEKVSNKKVDLIFVPHLVPMDRGILSTIYIELEKDLTIDEIYEMYNVEYSNEPFIRIYDSSHLVATKNVAFTNFCDMGIYKVAPANVIIITAIDNLYKGASSQAVQNLNIIAGIDEITGLL